MARNIEKIFGIFRRIVTPMSEQRWPNSFVWTTILHTGVILCYTNAALSHEIIGLYTGRHKYMPGFYERVRLVWILF